MVLVEILIFAWSKWDVESSRDYESFKSDTGTREEDVLISINVEAKVALWYYYLRDLHLMLLSTQNIEFNV